VVYLALVHARMKPNQAFINRHCAPRYWNLPHSSAGIPRKKTVEFDKSHISNQSNRGRNPVIADRNVRLPEISNQGKIKIYAVVL